MSVVRPTPANVPGVPDDLMDAQWYALPNDVIGGWSVMPVPLPPSSGAPEVACFMGEEEARHIAELHNAWRSGRPPNRRRWMVVKVRYLDIDGERWIAALGTPDPEPIHEGSDPRWVRAGDRHLTCFADGTALTCPSGWQS